jgi:hypothetical protein
VAALSSAVRCSADEAAFGGAGVDRTKTTAGPEMPPESLEDRLRKHEGKLAGTQEVDLARTQMIAEMTAWKALVKERCELQKRIADQEQKLKGAISSYKVCTRRRRVWMRMHEEISSELDKSGRTVFRILENASGAVKGRNRHINQVSKAGQPRLERLRAAANRSIEMNFDERRPSAVTGLPNGAAGGLETIDPCFSNTNAKTAQAVLAMMSALGLGIPDIVKAQGESESSHAGAARLELGPAALP